MATNDTHERFSDELLSAYLDDELTSAERAEVEARLAADPAAQQTLDELRAVSQAVRDLPREGADTGLRTAVLARLETAAADKSANVSRTESVESAAAPDSTFRLPLGRSRRGWAWAALAVAAAIVIMVYDQAVLRPGGEPNFEVAHRITDQPASEEPADRRGRAVVDVDRGERLLEFSELEDRNEPADLGEAAFVAPTDSDFSDSGVEPAEAPRSEERRLPAGTSTLSVAPRPDTGPVEERELNESLAWTPDGSALLVRVSMPASARRNMEFENKLAKNRIILEDSENRRGWDRAGAGRFYSYQPAPTDESADSRDKSEAENRLEDVADGVAPQRDNVEQLGVLSKTADGQQLLYRAKLLEQQRAPDGTPVDVILVEAPAKPLFECLQEISRDNVNFTAVKCEPTGEQTQWFAEQLQSQSEANVKQMTAYGSFSKESQVAAVLQLNRGQIPAEQRAIAPPIADFVRQKAALAQQPQQPVNRYSITVPAEVDADLPTGSYGRRGIAAAGEKQHQVIFLLGTEPNGAPPVGKKASAR